MSFEVWFSFVLATSALLAVPGPTVMLVVSYALGSGRSAGWATVPGVTLGDFTAMTVSLLGAGVVLAASATLFTILKYFGAAYLIWLGIKLWRSEAHLTEVPNAKQGVSRKSMFWNSWMVTTLNPKGIVFFVAFVPQFVDVSQKTLPQFIILEATFLVLAFTNILLWALLASKLRDRFKRPRTLQLANRTGAAFLIGAGLVTATIRRGN
jgi:threonine/homoserine/homoserine lactone efflux protein